MHLVGLGFKIENDLQLVVFTQVIIHESCKTKPEEVVYNNDQSKSQSQNVFIRCSKLDRQTHGQCQWLDYGNANKGTLPTCV